MHSHERMKAHTESLLHDCILSKGRKDKKVFALLLSMAIDSMLTKTPAYHKFRYPAGMRLRFDFQ